MFKEFISKWLNIAISQQTEIEIKKISENNQEMPQSHTTDQPMAM